MSFAFFFAFENNSFRVSNFNTVQVRSQKGFF